MITAERLVPAGLVLGEGPIAGVRGDDYACVDIRAGTVFSGDLSGRFDESGVHDMTVSALALDRDDRVVRCVGHGVLAADGGRIELPDRRSRLRTNDAKVDPFGRLVVGTMADPPQPGAGSLWRIDRGVPVELLDDLTISNGLAWSGDGDTLFHVDTPMQRIDAYDYGPDGLVRRSRRTVAVIPPDSGSPDGMTIDVEGGLWVALWGGGAVHRYVDGRLDDVIDVPTAHVTCPVFVGPDLETLLITTASEPTPGESGAGDVYVATTGIGGRPATRLDPTSLRAG